MSDSTTQSLTADPTPDLGNIQGDIVLGLPKKVEEYVFFRITNADEFRKQLNKVIPYITTTAQVKQAHVAINKQKNEKPGELIVLPMTNIGFSNFGLIKMGITKERIDNELKDLLFANGQLKDAKDLGDQGKIEGDTFVPNWDAGFKQELDGILIFTAEKRATLAKRIEEVHKLLCDSYEVVISVFGNDRPGNQHKHEHFGFLDDISEPAVTGISDEELDVGQTTIDPGVIVLGNKPDLRNSKLAKDGSFLAFRKLNQLVPEFHTFLLENGKKFFGPVDKPEIGAEFLGARLFGRWKSGAPIDITPFKDCPELATDPKQRNNFSFTRKFPDDQTDQTRCPFAAHIRKTNPRGDLPLTASDPHRITRQGIAFGPEVTEMEKEENVTYYERGLAFACYQSDISKGFAFQQKSWSNNTNFPLNKPLSPGFDPIIGQNNGKERWMSGYNPGAQDEQLCLNQDYVVSRGGEYFFAPSIIALKDEIATATSTSIVVN